MNKYKFLTAYTISSIGDWLYKLALPILLYQQTKSAMAMSIAYALTFLPFVIITPFGGVLADRLKRQKILIYGDLIATLFTGILALILTFALHSLWLAYIFIFLLASITSLCHPAFQGFIPHIAEKNEYAKVNSMIANVDNLILLLGPLCSGILIAVFGGTISLYINALSFLLSVLLVSNIKPKIIEQLKTNAKITFANIFSDLHQGFNYAMKEPTIKYGCILFIFSNFGINIFYANFMYYLITYLHLDATHVGYTIAITGVGSIIGALIAPQFISRYTAGRIILFCSIFEGIPILCLLFAKSYLSVGIYWGITSALGSIIVVTYFTLRQKIIPTEYLGRTVAVTRAISYSIIPIASALGGVILKYTNNIYNLMYLGGSVLLLNGIFGMFSPLAKSENNVFIKAQDE